jgi:hypothetical protein
LTLLVKKEKKNKKKKQNAKASRICTEREIEGFGTAAA